MKTSYIKDEKGNTVGVRETTDDGRTSVTYEYDRGALFDPRGKAIDITDHNEDGTSRSYEYEYGHMFDPRGSEK